jgi:hypothetical protein
MIANLICAIDQRTIEVIGDTEEGSHDCAFLNAADSDVDSDSFFETVEEIDISSMELAH